MYAKKLKISSNDSGQPNSKEINIRLRVRVGYLLAWS